MFIGLAMALCLGVTGGKTLLWSDPGRIETIDFTHAFGGPALAPAPPFQFLKEDDGGTSPKVMIRDAKGVEWRMKGGLEVRAETFVTRFVAAMGYYSETTYFIAKGKVEGVPGRLGRASGFIQPDGAFTFASLERREEGAKFLEDEKWTWDQSPFRGSREKKGLKILVMLFSNWDNKDARDEYKGSNTSVVSCGSGKVYFVNDWGQTLGRWGHGGFFGRHSMWDCRSYAAQTPQFTLGTQKGYVRFGYAGQHTEDFKAGITVDDVRWLMQYLGRVTDAQIRAGLLTSGATREEEDCFARALRDRIEQLRRIAGGGAAAEVRR